MTDRCGIFWFGGVGVGLFIGAGPNDLPMMLFGFVIATVCLLSLRHDT